MKIIRYMFLLVALAALPGCKSDPARPGEKGRTVLVYMVASNTLGDEVNDPDDPRSFDRRDLDEMVEAASQGALGKARWLVYHHPRKGAVELKELTPGGFRTVKTYDDISYSVSIARMTEVFNDMRATAPADDYGLILWSHAAGWLETGLDEPQATAPKSKKPRYYGDDRGRHMNIKSLRAALETCPFSFVYADVCNMAAVEVAYELRKVTPMFVGSVSQMPADGMPYDRAMRYLTAPTADLVSAARTTFEYYSSLPAAEHMWSTMSVIATAGLDDLARETRRVYRSSAYPPGYSARPLDYTFRYYSDLGHFVDALSPADKAWHDALGRTVVYQAATPSMLGMPIDAHCGLSTYILTQPSDSEKSGYSTLQWYADVARYQPLPQ